MLVPHHATTPTHLATLRHDRNESLEVCVAQSTPRSALWQRHPNLIGGACTGDSGFGLRLDSPAPAPIVTASHHSDTSRRHSPARVETTFEQAALEHCLHGRQAVNSLEDVPFIGLATTGDND